MTFFVLFLCIFLVRRCSSSAKSVVVGKLDRIESQSQFVI